MADSSKWSQEDLDAYAKRYAPPTPAGGALPGAPGGDPGGMTQSFGDGGNTGGDPGGMTQTFGGTPGLSQNSSGWSGGVPPPGTGTAGPGTPISTMGAPPPPPITTAGQVTGTATTSGGQIPQGAPTTVAQSFQQSLVNRLNQAPLSASSPEVAPAIEANKLQEQRGFERNRNLLAERNAAVNGGSPSGGFETGLTGLAQDRAGREGSFAGNAVMQASQERGINDRAAMASASDLLGGNANRAQQQHMADQDAQLRREGLNAQTSLGQGDLDLRGKLGSGQLNLGLLSALLNNRQFNDQLGQNGAIAGQGFDTQTLLGLLGGL
jgi:hypothetical protein